MNQNYYGQPLPSNSPMMPGPNMGYSSSSHPHMHPPNMPPHMYPPNMPQQNMPPQYNGPNSNQNLVMNSNANLNNNNGQFQEQQFLKPPVQSTENACFEELDGIDQVEIKQDADCLDWCFPRCTSNKYNVVFYTGQEAKETKLYELIEASDCMQRCCCYKCHAFKMEITNVTSDRNNKKSVVMEGDKACNLGIIGNCCGCGKPEFKVQVKSPQQFVLGKAMLNYSSCCCACCSSSIDVIGNSNEVKYKLKGNCCCPVGCYYDNVVTRCCSCSYKVLPGTGEKQAKEEKEEKETGVVTKKCCNSCITCCTKATNYNIAFPKDASPEEKMLIIIGSILLDYNSYYL